LSIPPQAKAKTPPTKVDFSIVVPIRNEEESIGRALQALADLDYPQDKIEIIVVDGCSTDRSVTTVQEWAKKQPNIRLLKNPNRLSSSGRNIGVKESSGEVIVFIEGHCFVHRDFLKGASEYLQKTGAACLGRPITLCSGEHSRAQTAISIARSSFLGHSLTSYVYRNGSEGYVAPTSVATIYRREVFDKVGFFDERFDACEDLEFNYRVNKAGILCYFGPEMQADYISRPTFRGLFRQLSRYGRGRFRFLLKHPEAIRPNTIIPPLFVLCWLLLPVAYFISSFLMRLILIVLGSYWLLVAGFSAWLALSKRKANFFLLASSFFIIHFALGLNFLQEGLRIVLRRGPTTDKPPRKHA
jgi:succinoglycan biosynthesis protein ExoA